MTADRQWDLPVQRMLRPREVAALFDVSAKTITRWAQSGRLPYVRTIGGHRRFALTTVQDLLRDGSARANAGQAEGVADAEAPLVRPKWEDEAL